MQLPAYSAPGGSGSSSTSYLGTSSSCVTTTGSPATGSFTFLGRATRCSGRSASWCARTRRRRGRSRASWHAGLGISREARAAHRRQWRRAEFQARAATTGAALQPTQGVADAARDARAVVTAAGTDAGVSKLVASAMEKGNIKQAVIGFAPFGRILGGKELLGKVEGGSVAYSHLPANKDKGQAAPLNPDHTHFILVESPGNEWGSESKLRAELEAEYAQRMKVPIVGLAVQGGPGTVQMLYENALRQTPCVVVAQSGGASTELWEYFKSDQRGAPELPRFPSGHKHAGKPKYQASPTLNWFAEILKRHKECGGLLVIFYDIDGEVEDLSHCLLKAVVDFKLLDFKTRKAAAIGQGGTALQALETEAAQVDGALGGEVS
eukprot:Transcript_8260.p1 GENE.Transcript_8260~~Transcript_8260.p1  ORF type:complete len:380 (+),score=80.82 Transcript_8260:61-1200(+)